MWARDPRIRRFAVLLLPLLLAASAYRPIVDLGRGSAFVGEPPGRSDREPFRMSGPRAVIVYLNGSIAEGKRDPCSRRILPRVVADLDGQMVDGVRLTVFLYCTPSKTGGFNQKDGDGVAKVLRRTEDAESLLLHILADGVPADRLFLMGQSAGAWAGLLVQTRGYVPVAGMVGFAPAFAGRKAYRGVAWAAERERQVAWITGAQRLDALIYGFNGDPYEAPDAMTWLADRHDILYRQSPCVVARPHATAYSACFRRMEAGRILAYLATRLQRAASF